MEIKIVLLGRVTGAKTFLCIYTTRIILSKGPSKASKEIIAVFKEILEYTNRHQKTYN